MTKVDISKYRTKRANVIKDIFTKEIELSIFSRDVFSDIDKSKFYGQLSTLLDAGVDLRTCLEIIGNEQTKKSKKIKQVENLVVEGTELYNALRQVLKISDYEFYSLKIGEETGRLSIVAKDISDFFYNKQLQRRKFISTFSYPLVVLITAFSVVFFMLRYLVPMFDNVYKRFGGDLPWITKQIVKASNWLAQYGLYFMLLFILLIGLNIYFKNNENYKRIKDGLFQKIPIVGKLLKQYYLAQFSRFMYLLISSKVGITQALNLTGRVVDNAFIKKALPEVEESILNGNSLSTALDQQDFFDKKIIALIKVGEEVNQLDVMFKQLSDDYAKEFEYQSEILNKFLEPLIILFLGVVIGFILVAMYLPMFKLSSNLL